MREQQKKIKFTNRLKNLGLKFKWHLFTELQDFKLTQDYIDFICPDTKQSKVDSVSKLESMVQNSLIREFSPEIQNTKSFRLLTDAVMYRIQKKALKTKD